MTPLTGCQKNHIRAVKIQNPDSLNQLTQVPGNLQNGHISDCSNDASKWTIIIINICSSWKALSVTFQYIIRHQLIILDIAALFAGSRRVAKLITFMTSFTATDNFSFKVRLGVWKVENWTCGNYWSITSYRLDAIPVVQSAATKHQGFAQSNTNTVTVSAYQAHKCTVHK